jgi:hypothetical protein
MARADDEITRFNFDTIMVGGRNLSFIPVPDNSHSPPGPGSFPNSSGDLWGVVDENINHDVPVRGDAAGPSAAIGSRTRLLAHCAAAPEGTQR